MLKRSETARTVNSPMPVPVAHQPEHGIRLVLQIHGTKARTLALKMKDRMLVGCGGAHWELDLDLFPFDGATFGVSRRHLAFIADGENIWAEDLQSECGTRINGVLMQPGREIRLRNGDELALGDLLMTVRLVRVA